MFFLFNVIKIEIEITPTNCISIESTFDSGTFSSREETIITIKNTNPTNCVSIDSSFDGGTFCSKEDRDNNNN